MTKQKLFTHVMNVVTVAVIVECFLCAMMLVNKFGREHCFERIEESTHQVAAMFRHGMEKNQDNLTVFADILGANSTNPETLLQTYMKNFCTTQDYDAVCIHRADDTIVSYGSHPHELVELPSFQTELDRLPYTSQVYGTGSTPAERMLYQAVPINRDGQTVAILYGYLTLDDFPSFITSTAYDGKGEFYIVDGDTGDFLMDEYHGQLYNIYDGSLGSREAQKGYDGEAMNRGIQNGESGFHIFRSKRTGDWYYTYYTPLGINNWSMQMTIDETTAFASYRQVNHMLLVLAACVIVFMLLHVLVLMKQEQRNNRRDRENLQKSQYINSVQRALINAHNTPDFVGQALKIIAQKTQSETTVLMSFVNKTVTAVQYWPSKDKDSVQEMLGRNIRDDFPMLYDQLAAKENVIFEKDDPQMDLSQQALAMFEAQDIRNLLMVPIMDNAGNMKGALAAVNSAMKKKSCDMLECVTYDFFMAMSNQENQAIIQRMGAMDYLTNIKNRNSFESEVYHYAHMNCQTLWCVFIDVNGLHDVNNTYGHKAGDLMLCAVAEAVKRAFGEVYTYRLGGDEFVAFVPDGTEEDLNHRKTRICQELARKNYFISIGCAGIGKGADAAFDVSQVVSEAESIMYQDKWEYYKRNNLPTERGHFPARKKEAVSPR